MIVWTPVAVGAYLTLHTSELPPLLTAILQLSPEKLPAPLLEKATEPVGVAPSAVVTRAMQFVIARRCTVAGVQLSVVCDGTRATVTVVVVGEVVVDVTV